MRLRNAVVIGLAGGVPDGGWAGRVTGRTSARIATDEIFIRPPEKGLAWMGSDLRRAHDFRNATGRTVGQTALSDIDTTSLAGS